MGHIESASDGDDGEIDPKWITINRDNLSQRTVQMLDAVGVTTWGALVYPATMGMMSLHGAMPLFELPEQAVADPLLERTTDALHVAAMAVWAYSHLHHLCPHPLGDSQFGVIPARSTRHAWPSVSPCPSRSSDPRNLAFSLG